MKPGMLYGYWRNMTTKRLWFLPLFMLLMMVIAVPKWAEATQTERWIVDTTEDFLKGEGDGVAVDPAGRLVRAPSWKAVVEFIEPVSFAGDVAPDGALIVGTGHPAVLYKVEGEKQTKLADVPAEQVTAVLVTSSSVIYVATMGPGALFRLDSDQLVEVGRLGEGTIWDLDEFDGVVIAATGPPASLYRVEERGLVRWVELPDVHARCLDTVNDRLIVGTSGTGLILAVDNKGQMGLLSDSKFTEISDLVSVPDGSIWATALVGEPEPATTSAKNGDKEKSSGTETGTIDLDLPKINGSSATSEVLRLTPEGALMSVHRFSKQIASALSWDGSAVLVGTGYEGELWRFVNSGGTRITTVDAVHVVAILGKGEAMLTQGPAQVVTPQSGSERSRFRVKALRLGSPVIFGEYRVESSSESYRIRFRSGISEKPDETWLPWTEWFAPPQNGVDLPVGASLQWEIDLGGAESIERIEVAYREVNLEPVIKAFNIEEPGLVFLNAPPPSGPVIDVSHPDVSGIFSVVGDGLNSKPKTTKGKKYWRVGFRTLSWKVEDPNKDPLRFNVEIEDEQGFRMLVRDDLKINQLAVDTTAVPDGRYRFHLEATDAESNPGDGRTVSYSSRWIDIDNSPPRITIEQRNDLWIVVVEDAVSSIVRAEYSRDGAHWQAVAPSDGLFDGRREEFEIAVKQGRHKLMVRAVDRHHNRSSAGVLER